MCAHFILHVSPNREIRTRPRGTQQNKTGFAILGEISDRVVRIECAGANQFTGTGEAAALMADRRECDSRALRAIPDVLLRIYRDDTPFVRQFERHIVGSPDGALLSLGSPAKSDPRTRLAEPEKLEPRRAEIIFMGCRSRDSCCRELHPACRAGNARTEWICHPARARAVR